MQRTSTTWLVINIASGSYSAEALATLEDGLARADHTPARVIAIPDDAAPSPAELDRAGVGLLAIYAGDGTINSVVTGLNGWTGRILVLPGGTQNLMAKALHGDATAQDIVTAFAEGKLVSTPWKTVRTSQGDALCEVLAGPGARWSDVREALREGDVGGVAAKLGEAIGESTGGAAVRVVEPATGKPEGYPAVRVHPVAGELTVDGYAAETLGEYAQQGLALLRRDFREGPHDELGLCRAVVCRSDEPIELMIDGERKTGQVEERFEVAECPVEFLALNAHRTGS